LQQQQVAATASCSNSKLQQQVAATASCSNNKLQQQQVAATSCSNSKLQQQHVVVATSAPTRMPLSHSHTHMPQSLSYMLIYIFSKQVRIDWGMLSGAYTQGHTTGWQRPITRLDYIGHFPQKSPIISSSFAKNHRRRALLLVALLLIASAEEPYY